MSTARRIVFGPPQARVVGVLVSPSVIAESALLSGVVICDPFGIEALAADRSMNHLTAALAREGHAVLRFAPPGLGDSGELPEGGSIVGPWRAAIDAAIDVLRSEIGCVGITLVGLRVGAALAAEVASARDDVARLVLWAPVAGRPFVRELKMLGAGVAAEPSARNCGTTAPLAVEAGGFGLSAASVAELAAVDPFTLIRRPAADILIVDRDDIRSGAKLAAHLTGLGAQVESPELTGYAAMRLDDPEAGEVPTKAIEAIAAWISRMPMPAGQDCVRQFPDHAVSDALELAADTNGLVESSVRIPVNGGRELHGIVTRSVDARDNALALVLLTTGSNPCCGAGRLHTRLARHWAGDGHTVVRLDRRGVGLSELSQLLHAGPATRVATEADDRNRTCGLGDAYDDTHVDDVTAIEQFVRAELGGERVVLVGTCSGAYTAYRAASSGRVRPGRLGIIAINQIIFDDHAWTTDGESPAYAIKARYELGQALRHPSRWINVLRGEIPVLPAIRRLTRFASIRLRTATRVTAAKLRRRTAPAFGVSADVQAIAASGIRQTYVFDDAETGLGYLRLHADASMAALLATGQLSQHTVAGAGHTFGPEWSKEWLIATLDRTLADLARIPSVL